MDLKFDIYQKEFIKISISDSGKEILDFFRTSFNKQLKDNSIKIRKDEFLRKRKDFSLLKARLGLRFEMSESFREFIARAPTYNTVKDNTEIDEVTVLQKLDREKFSRIPTKNQLNNLRKLCALPAGASFSVPGAGKTTEALGFYAFHKKSDKTKLLVISPINAFISWKEEIKKCFSKDLEIQRLRGKAKEVGEILINDPTHMIINYDALRNPERFNLIKQLILDNDDLVVVLDESHKIKGKEISKIMHQLSPLISRKLILTGTPMPQDVSDLKSQFNFIFPEERVVDADQLPDKFQPVFVRTTKGQLDYKYPDIKYKKTFIDPSSAFMTFYDEYLRKKLDQGFALEDLLEVRSLKKAVLKLIMFFSRPYSCIDMVYKLDESLAERIESEGFGAKIDAAIKSAKDLISQNKKVVIWTSFKKNVEDIAEVFGDQAVFIHGGVNTADQSEEKQFAEFDTREKRIDKFKNDPNCMVLVANPAAASESISLHENCDHAIYVDRTFNAGQFMQSRDRIHRLIERSKEREKHIEIIMLNLPGSVEQRVHDAIEGKIKRMAEFLDDPSLKSLGGFSEEVSGDEEEVLMNDITDSELNRVVRNF